MSSRVAVYPGSFDPIHNGHLDIIERCRPMFDEVVIAVLHNEDKNPLFTVEERMEMIRSLVGGDGIFRVESFSGLLVEFMEQIRAHTIVRGLRAVSDFEYEMQLAMMNRHLAHDVETVFMMPAAQFSFVSSRLVKEVFTFGGEITGLVPPAVEARLLARRSGEKG